MREWLRRSEARPFPPQDFCSPCVCVYCKNNDPAGRDPRHSSYGYYRKDLGELSLCPNTPDHCSLRESSYYWVPGIHDKSHTHTWMVLVSFRAGVTVPTGGFMKAAGELRFKLSFSRASATWWGFGGGTVPCCLREFNISLASCTFPLIRKRASFCKSFSRASLTPSLSRASERPIFCLASNLCWKVAVRAGWLRKLCWIPT